MTFQCLIYLLDFTQTLANQEGVAECEFEGFVGTAEDQYIRQNL